MDGIPGAQCMFVHDPACSAYERRIDFHDHEIAPSFLESLGRNDEFPPAQASLAVSAGKGRLALDIGEARCRRRIRVVPKKSEHGLAPFLD